ARKTMWHWPILPAAGFYPACDLDMSLDAARKSARAAISSVKLFLRQSKGVRREEMHKRFANILSFLGALALGALAVSPAPAQTSGKEKPLRYIYNATWVVPRN